MIVRDLVDLIKVTVINEGNNFEKTITGCYIGDLLSWVMSNAEEGNIWITIMSNVNVAAVAKLTDVACVLMCENVSPDDDCFQRAKEQGVTILKTNLSAYQAAVEIGKHYEAVL